MKKLQKLSGLFLALAIVLSLNLTVFAAEPESIERQTYQVEVGGEIYTVSDEAVIEIPMKSLTPVSYTHLDVYKRQMQYTLHNVLALKSIAQYKKQHIYQ